MFSTTPQNEQLFFDAEFSDENGIKITLKFKTEK
jgi:hypothetical protein